MRRMMTFIAGAFCGALVGAVTALLFAPYGGEELRGRARDRIESFRDEVREAYQTSVAQLEAEIETLRSRRTAQEE